jgi:hypothetical protein
MVEDEASAEILRLQARVAGLEKGLEERSRLLREITEELCDDDVLNVSRMAAGLPPVQKAVFLELRRTTSLTSGDVEETMTRLWRSLKRERRRA